MELRHILEEIEQAATRCTEAGTAVQDALDALDLGFIYGFLQTVASDAPVRNSRRPLSASSSGNLVGSSDGLLAKFERFQASLLAESKAVSGKAGIATATPRRHASEKSDKVSSAGNVGGTDSFAELRKMFTVQSREHQPLPPRSPLDKLRDVLAKAEHPLVRALYEANDALEHVETTILPKVDVLTEEYQDKTIASHYVKMIGLTEKRVEATKFVGRLIPELLKHKPVEGASPVEGAKFLDVAFGRGRDSLVGLFVGCTILTEMGAYLKQVASRLRTKIAISGAKVGPLHHEPLPSAQDSLPNAYSKPTSGVRDITIKHGAERDVDFVILTAIDVELRAVRAAFGLIARDRVKMDARVYWRGKLPLENGESYTIVVAQAADMANTDAALTTADMLHHWNPNAALLVGIAATTSPSKVKLGDVVVGSDVYYYERGKVARKRTMPEPKSIPADLTLWNNMRSTEWDGEVDALRPDNSDARSMRHYGVIACGEQVIADSVTRDRIAAVDRKILAIEMEGYGFSLAVWHSFEKVRHLDIRGICDDGSETKDDRWHEYAATAAASLAKQFLLDRPLEPRDRTRTPLPGPHAAQPVAAPDGAPSLAALGRAPRG